ncbi:MBG domain-containing protein [Pediococcus claussenii]|uniref:Cell-wall-anchored protein (LPXTG motif) n=1 Tax=Pediococcus claussenii (strain ATCC BAA-344 / DSM 14800 / JCM 18046 / KCTC 3811 / LMG 21948 / P06) TaxID=701521 RepID=G8PCD6_PEDCP|nr:MBG domain-containing protein [Pediococcus claussenii]AEV94921.1 putative cell-wall-anchored protein (LPXTG motif) [Pediococcus claussenii ATCC BAA-344]
MSFWRKNHKSTNLNTKNHYKMYKAGKQWLFAGITTIAGLGGQSIAGAKADSLSATSTATKDVQDQDVLATGDSAIIPAESSVASSSVATASATSATLSSASSAVSSSNSSNTSSASASSADTSSSSSSVASGSNTTSSSVSSTSSSSATSSANASSNNSNSSSATSSTVNSSSNSAATSSTAESSSPVSSSSSVASITSNALSSATSGTQSLVSSGVTNTTSSSATTSSTATSSSAVASLSMSNSMSLSESQSLISLASLNIGSSVAASSAASSAKKVAMKAMVMAATVAPTVAVNVGSLSYNMGTQIAYYALRSWKDSGLNIVSLTPSWLLANFTAISALLTYYQANGTVLRADGTMDPSLIAALSGIYAAPSWSGQTGIKVSGSTAASSGYTQNGSGWNNTDYTNDYYLIGTVKNPFSATDYYAGIASILNVYAQEVTNYFDQVATKVQDTSGGVGNSLSDQLASYFTYNPNIAQNQSGALGLLANVTALVSPLLSAQGSNDSLTGQIPGIFGFHVTTSDPLIISDLTQNASNAYNTGSLQSLDNLISVVMSSLQPAIEKQLFNDIRTLGINQSGSLSIPSDLYTAVYTLTPGLAQVISYFNFSSLLNLPLLNQIYLSVVNGIRTAIVNDAIVGVNAAFKNILDPKDNPDPDYSTVAGYNRTSASGAANTVQTTQNTTLLAQSVGYSWAQQVVPTILRAASADALNKATPQNLNEILNTLLNAGVITSAQVTQLTVAGTQNTSYTNYVADPTGAQNLITSLYTAEYNAVQQAVTDFNNGTPKGANPTWTDPSTVQTDGTNSGIETLTDYGNVYDYLVKVRHDAMVDADAKSHSEKDGKVAALTSVSGSTNANFNTTAGLTNYVTNAVSASGILSSTSDISALAAISQTDYVSEYNAEAALTNTAFAQGAAAAQVQIRLHPNGHLASPASVDYNGYSGSSDKTAQYAVTTDTLQTGQAFTDGYLASVDTVTEIAAPSAPTSSWTTAQLTAFNTAIKNAFPNATQQSNGNWVIGTDYVAPGATNVLYTAPTTVTGFGSTNQTLTTAGAAGNTSDTVTFTFTAGVNLISNYGIDGASSTGLGQDTSFTPTGTALTIPGLLTGLNGELQTWHNASKILFDFNNTTFSTTSNGVTGSSLSIYLLAYYAQLGYATATDLQTAISNEFASGSDKLALQVLALIQGGLATTSAASSGTVTMNYAFKNTNVNSTVATVGSIVDQRGNKLQPDTTNSLVVGNNLVFQTPTIPTGRTINFDNSYVQMSLDGSEPVKYTLTQLTQILGITLTGNSQADLTSIINAFNEANGNVTITTGNLLDNLQALTYIQLNPQASTASVSGSQSVTYTGSVPALTTGDYTVTLADGSTYTLQAGDIDIINSSKNAGTYQVELTAQGLANINAASADHIYTIDNSTLGTLVINKANATINVDGTQHVYTGDTYNATATATGAVNGETLNYTVSGSQTEIGSSPVAVNFDPADPINANYNITVTGAAVITVVRNATSDSNSTSASESMSDLGSVSASDITSVSQSNSIAGSISISNSNNFSASNSIVESASTSASKQSSIETNDKVSELMSDSASLSEEASAGGSQSLQNSQSLSNSMSTNGDNSISNVNSLSESNSLSAQNSLSIAQGNSLNNELSDAESGVASGDTSQSNSVNDAGSQSLVNSVSESNSIIDRGSDGSNDSISNSNSYSVANSNSVQNSISASNSLSLDDSNNVNSDTSESVSLSISNSQNIVNSVSTSTSGSTSFSMSGNESVSGSTSISESESLSSVDSVSGSVSNSNNVSNTTSASLSLSNSNSESTVESLSVSNSLSGFAKC